MWQSGSTGSECRTSASHFSCLTAAEVNQRVDVMVGANGTGQGRMGWLALGWPEEFRRLAAVLPRMREMA